MAACALWPQTVRRKRSGEAFVNRRVYGVSQEPDRGGFLRRWSRNGKRDHDRWGEAELSFRIKGTAAVDRVEILRDNILEKMVVHSGTWERKEQSGVIRFKFRLEFGWGPDIRVYPDAICRVWNGLLKVDGKLLGVEKCWNNFGQELTSQTEDSCEFSLTTYQSTATGKWMGPSNVTTEGFIFEVEADADSSIHLTVEGKKSTHFW